MKFIRSNLMRRCLFVLLMIVSHIGRAPPAMALEDLLISYAGPSITFSPRRGGASTGFLSRAEPRCQTASHAHRSRSRRAGQRQYILHAQSRLDVRIGGRGLPVRIVFLGTTKPFWGLVVRPEIKSVSELKGKSMGVPGLLGSQQISAKFILKQSGLDPDRDIIYRVVDTGTRISAMLSGSIDCAMMDYGEAFRAKKLGLKLLINAADYHGLLAGGLGVNSGKLREQPDQVRRVISAMLQALRYMRENPEGAQQVMMSWLKLDHEMAADIYQMAINNYTRNGMVEDSMLNSLVTTMLAEAGIKGVAPSQLTDFTLLRQALK